MDHEIQIIIPKNYGWLEKKLNFKEVKYLWNCIDNSKKLSNNNIANQISDGKCLHDVDDWFFNTTLLPLCVKYAEKFGNIGNSLPVNNFHPYILDLFWVNFQKKNEFNPIHLHKGIYSFIVWLKIPTKHSEQNLLSSKISKISTFQIHYLDILGKMSEFVYEMNPEIEGTIIFFPSNLHHSVNPFWNCDDERISISGNIFIDTNRIIN